MAQQTTLWLFLVGNIIHTCTCIFRHEMAAVCGLSCSLGPSAEAAQEGSARQQDAPSAAPDWRCSLAPAAARRGVPTPQPSRRGALTPLRSVGGTAVRGCDDPTAARARRLLVFFSTPTIATGRPSAAAPARARGCRHRTAAGRAPTRPRRPHTPRAPPPPCGTGGRCRPGRAHTPPPLAAAAAAAAARGGSRRRHRHAPRHPTQGCGAPKDGNTAVLPKIPHSNCCKRVPNRPLRGRRGRFGTLLQLLECGTFWRTAVGEDKREAHDGQPWALDEDGHGLPLDAPPAPWPTQVPATCPSGSSGGKETPRGPSPQKETNPHRWHGVWRPWWLLHHASPADGRGSPLAVAATRRPRRASDAAPGAAAAACGGRHGPTGTEPQ